MGEALGERKTGPRRTKEDKAGFPRRECGRPLRSGVTLDAGAGTIDWHRHLFLGTAAMTSLIGTSRPRPTRTPRSCRLKNRTDETVT
jgi:hypothetical protein